LTPFIGIRMSKSAIPREMRAGRSTTTHRTARLRRAKDKVHI
jgi:hypothetical protein